MFAAKREASGGNLPTRTGNGTYTYADHKHAVTSTSDGSTVAYDDNGNMTDRDIAGQPDQTLTWNADQRLQSLAIAGGATTTFLYDADGNRVRRNTGNNTVYYTPGGSEYERESGVGTFTHYYTIGGDTVAYRNGTTLTWLWSDHLGSSVVTKTAAGSAVKQRYTPWGELRTDGNLTTDRHYTGQIADQATGLAFYNARYYDPAVGRFISPDSIIPNPGNGQDLNRYTYVRNNPIRYNDPTGNTPCPLNDSGCLAGASERGRQEKSLNACVGGGNGQLTQQGGCDNIEFDLGSQRCNGRQDGWVVAAQCGLVNSIVGNLDVAGNIRGLYELMKSCQSAVSTAQDACIARTIAAGYQNQYHNEGLASVGGAGAPDVIGFFLARKVRSPAPRLPGVGDDVVVIGKVDDLNATTLAPGERTLLDQLPNQGSPRANYVQNESVLRTEMSRGVPIRDASVSPTTGELVNNTGFLRAERDILSNHGWSFDTKSGYWLPPG